MPNSPSIRDKYSNGKQFIQSVDKLALVLLYQNKKGFINSKGYWLGETEAQIVKWFSTDFCGDLFLDNWVERYMLDYSAQLYAHYKNVTGNSELADIYSDAFIARYIRFIL
jgi:hypothetical protein|tara:strand:+ start:4610 stop:4942 length:333 start_codon:yes stop_codon:yes gene_type:complete